MSNANNDRNLLYGILALQMDFIGRDALIAGMNAWVLEKHRSLADLLEERGAPAKADRSLLEALVARHVEAHGGDPAQSLATLSSVDWLRADLAAVRTDPDVEASLARLKSSSTEEAASRFDGRGADSTDPVGLRYRVLRFHAKGGLGEVYVAKDLELHREVALKQIQERHGDSPETRSRFLLEAEITGGLEHPGIVPVYGLGRFSDGRPYYAMRFIKGDSLREAIGSFHRDETAPKTLGERTLRLQKLLRRFLDVCDAIAYAHSRGVLHRDIKPGNIMVGPFGETLVVDWGLAKVIGTRESGGEATLRPPSASDSADTLAGSAVGTPQYMSPEQASGRPDQVGRAGDVYSLGATLYCLLVGKAPIEDESGDVADMLARVRRGEFPAPRRISPTIPRPLEAICLKAMSLRPEDRYPSPRALGEDIERWLADEPVSAWREPIVVRARRWGRRNRTSLAAAAAALLATAIALGIGYRRELASNVRLAKINFDLDAANRKILETNAQLTRANQNVTLAKADSDRRLDQTFRVIEEYYTGVGEEVLLGSKEFEGLRRKLLEKPKAFYETLARELKAKPIADEHARLLLARGLAGLGKISNLSGEFEAARPTIEEAMRLYERFVQKRPADLDLQAEFALCLNASAIILINLNDRDAALKRLDQGIAIQTNLVRSRPNVSIHKKNLALALTIKATIQSMYNQWSEAGKTLDRCATIWTDLMRLAPDEIANLQGLASTYTLKANAQVLNGDPRGATESLKQSSNAWEKLFAAHPKLVDSLAGIILNLRTEAKILKSANDLPGSIRTLGKAVQTSNRLVEARPNHPAHLEGLANIHKELAETLGLIRDGRGALESYKRAVEIWNELALRDPGRIAHRKNLAVTLLAEAPLLWYFSQWKEAEESLGKAISLFRRLAVEEPKNLDLQRALASSLEYLGYYQGELNRAGEGAERTREAVAIRQRLAIASEDRPRAQIDLAVAFDSLGCLLRLSGRSRDAVDAHEQALLILRHRLKSQPKNDFLHTRLASAFNNLGLARLDLNESSEGMEALRESIEVWTKLADASPNVMDYQYRAAQSLHNMAVNKAIPLRTPRRDDLLLLAEARIRAARRIAPADPYVLSLYVNNCLARSRLAREEGRLPEAVQFCRDAQQVDQQVPPLVVLEIAREFGFCAEACSSDLREEAIEESIDALKVSIQRGLYKTAFALTDPCFRSFRDRAAFRSVVLHAMDRGFPFDPFGR